MRFRYKWRIRRTPVPRTSVVLLVSSKLSRSYKLRRRWKLFKLEHSLSIKETKSRLLLIGCPTHSLNIVSLSRLSRSCNELKTIYEVFIKKSTRVSGNHFMCHNLYTLYNTSERGDRRFKTLHLYGCPIISGLNDRGKYDRGSTDQGILHVPTRRGGIHGGLLFRGPSTARSSGIPSLTSPITTTKMETTRPLVTLSTHLGPSSGESEGS